jgi:hypothetical protein
MLNILLNLINIIIFVLHLWTTFQFMQIIYVFSILRETKNMQFCDLYGLKFEIIIDAYHYSMNLY